MEDQGKRLLLAVGIIAVLFVAWTYLFPPARQPTPPPPQPTAAAPAPAPAPASPSPATAVAPPAATDAATAPAPATVACEPETEGAPTWDTPVATLTFSRCGGTLSSYRLKGKQYTEHIGGKDVPMDLVRPRDNPAYYPLQVQVEAAAPGVTSPDEKRQAVVAARSSWELVSSSDKEVVFRLATSDGLAITKTFKLLADYALVLDVEVKNVSATAGQKRIVSPYLEMYGYQDPNVRDPSMFHYAAPTWGTACFVDGDFVHETVKQLQNELRSRTGDVRWTGPTHQYFLLVAAPLANEVGSCTRGVIAGSAGILRAALQVGVPATLEPGAALTQSFAVYAGPKLLDELKAVSKLVGKDTKLERAVDWGWLAILCAPMLFLLELFHGWVGSWGVSIILLTIVVKLLTLYWTQKSMRSMKAMSKLKPEMDKIREKYPDDKQKQNLEMMNLYKTRQISPFGGCLPLLLQMPIWFALYRTLATAAELYQAPFLGYIRDLTAPDPYFIIPIALTALMFLQARITPASVDSQQQKIMQWVMPIMMGVFSLLFPAGLAVYMLTNTILGMIHQLYMNRTDQSAPAPVAAVAASKPSAPAPRGESKPAGRKTGKNRAKA
jgi:YidC/Oxa1 family membrane protein insertase